MCGMVGVIILLAVFPAVNGDPVSQVEDACVLRASNESRAMFTDTVLRMRFNFMYLKLNFADLNETIRALPTVIGATHWIWTYKGEDGGHEYLFLPRDFGYLSFGLLWSKSNSSQYQIAMHHSGNCSGLTVGENKTDLLVGEAMGEMTSAIADRHDRYNSSFWCYSVRRFVRPGSLYEACKNAICTLQTIEYRCCKFVISFVTRKRHVECSKEHYHFNELWWSLPIIAGEVCFALYPLLLSNIGAKIQKLSRKSRPQAICNNVSDSEDPPEVKYIHLRQDYPVSFVSTVISPGLRLCKALCMGKVCSRLLRTLLIFIPMTFPGIRLYLNAKYSSHLIKAGVKRGAIVDFSSMIAGFRHTGQFLHILGGPFVAIVMYVTFGTLLLIFPENLGIYLVKGLFSPPNNPYFVLTIPLKYREKFSGISLKNRSGYTRIHNYLLIQLFMMLNWRFWQHVFRLFKRRWNLCLHPFLIQWTKHCVILVLAIIVILPFYFVFCLVELTFCFLYFAAPVVSCFFILLNAYITSLRTHFGDRSLMYNIFSRLFILATVVAFCITWYLNCIIFFDGFWLLTRVTMFTYTGIIQFPKLSYGYIILVFMAFYYFMNSLNNFGANYRELLKLSIQVCEKIQSKLSTEFVFMRKNSIPIPLFNFIINRHMPKRVQVCSTVIKVVLIISILWVSIELLIAFDKFQELSLVSHVFTVLFICALPKICRDLCVKQLRHKTRTKLRQRLYQTVMEYCNRNGNVDSSSDIEDFGVYTATGYEHLDIESD